MSTTWFGQPSSGRRANLRSRLKDGTCGWWPMAGASCADRCGGVGRAGAGPTAFEVTDPWVVGGAAVGDSTAGKSRTVFEVMRATSPHRLLIAPHDRGALPAAVDTPPG